ncbi:hypothetical protein EDC39_101513 [Geothermobacter ehrlichii]|uniref:Uncharacterized protein n=1 Tax=Geothermobacter ehrlichii TaxID=213224 RepID=A0A5D3WME2_9BACT|nr:hypothetical protein [Geothermobacter ehrlichii]TYP00346.1 hypothetical protein EDC39_101513 [Geothermobacter ehrlichii]
MNRVLILLLLVVFGVGNAWAMPAIECHCFRDREFDPARPAATDDYILATCQNSLLAHLFAKNKKEIVRARMSGVASRDLWLAFYLERKTGQGAGSWLERKGGGTSWIALAPKRILQELSPAKRDDDALAAAVIDRMLAEGLGVDAGALHTLRQRGTDDRQLIAGCVLGRLLGRSPVDLVRKVEDGKTTWGLLVAEARLRPTELNGAIGRLVARSGGR